MFYLNFESQEEMCQFSQLTDEQVGKIVKKMLFPFLNSSMTSTEEEIYNKLLKANNIVKAKNKAKVLKSWETRKKKKPKAEPVQPIPVNLPVLYKRYNQKPINKKENLYKYGEIEGVFSL